MHEQMTTDRRNFLKGSLAVGGAVAAGSAWSAIPLASADETPEEDAPTEGEEIYVCSEDWLGEPPVINDADIVETVDADVVVCGGGHAGVQCALAAAQAGVKVVCWKRWRKRTTRSSATTSAPTIHSS